MVLRGDYGQPGTLQNFISKLNEVYLKVTCDNPGICYELVQYFTFEVPGHKFMPAYRNVGW